MRNKFITSRQHGFCPGHSCEIQLICVLDDCASALELGHQVDVIYLDWQKHSIKSLMQDCYLNLSHMKLEGNYCNGLKNFYQIEGDVTVRICIDSN